ncbi:hypothetical protein ACFLWF_00705 [Chloroflexota bacterium]
MKDSQVIKFIAIICLATTITALIVARNSPAVGYESSIYAATPPFVWGALIFNLICGVSIIVHQIYTGKESISNLWTLGIFIILIAYTTILSLYITRGYTLWYGGHTDFHLGLAQDLLSSGHIDSTNFYPMIHIYLTQISSICAIPLIVLSKIIPLIFALFYVTFMYLLAKSVLPYKGQIIFATVASMTLVPDIYMSLMPNFLANMLLPLAFFLTIKNFGSPTTPWRLLFIIIVLLFPISHPVSSFIFLLMLLSIWLLPRIVNTIGRISIKSKLTSSSPAFSSSTFSTLLLLFAGGIAIAWISSFDVWRATIFNIYSAIFEGGTVRLDILMNQIAYAEGIGYSITLYFFKLYAVASLYIVFTLITFPILLKRFYIRPYPWNLVSLYAPIAACALVLIGLWFTRVGIEPQRLVVYIVIWCTPFVGYMLYKILKQAHFWNNVLLAKLTPLILVVVLVSTFVHGMAKLYPSPYLYTTNVQVTRMQLNGMEWVIHNKDMNLPFSSHQLWPDAFARYLLTLEERNARPDISSRGEMVAKSLPPPPHFGYDEQPTLGTSYTSDAYLVLDTKDKELYSIVYSEMATEDLKFLPQDFERLKEDSSLDHIYYNGSLDVYFIRGTSSS